MSPTTCATRSQRLLGLTGGALALVSGRPIADLDRLFAPLKLPAVGGHGAEMRVRGGEVDQLGDAACRRTCAGNWPRRRRRAPASWSRTRAIRSRCITARRRSTRTALRAHIAAGRAAFPGEAIEVLPGKAMFEVKRPASTKATACAS